MTRLGSYPGEAVVRAFKRAGWHVARRKKGTLRNLIRDAELSVEEFLKVIK